MANEYDNLYFENMVKSEKIFKIADSTSTNVSSVNVGSNAHISIKNDNATSISSNVNSIVKLAPQEIPQFSGSYTEWAAYHDIFSTLVHNNDMISDI